MIMSGVEDGLRLNFDTGNADGRLSENPETWEITIGRIEDSDICLRNDTFVSRNHAIIRWENDRWWLEDCNSTNGTYIENANDRALVKGSIPIEPGQLFCVGRTWIRIEQ